MIINRTSLRLTGNLNQPIIMCLEYFEKRIMHRAIPHTSTHYEQEIFFDSMQNGI
jgi:hypothetical protein